MERKADFRAGCTRITSPRRIHRTTTVTPTSVSHSILLWHHIRATEEGSINLLSGNSQLTSMEVRSKVVVLEVKVKFTSRTRPISMICNIDASFQNPLKLSIISHSHLLSINVSLVIVCSSSTMKGLTSLNFVNVQSDSGNCKSYLVEVRKKRQREVVEQFKDSLRLLVLFANAMMLMNFVLFLLI